MFTTMSMSQSDLITLLHDLGIRSDRLPDALALAERVHGAQRRAGGGPYLEEHVYPITAAVARYLTEVASDDVTNAVLTAILHDTIEDSIDVTEADLAERFGSAVAHGVDTLSKPSKRGGQTNAEDEAAEERYAAGIAGAPFEVRVIKVFDRLNNLSGVHQRPTAERRKYLAETRMHYIDLARDVDEALAQRMTELVEMQEKTLTD